MLLPDSIPQGREVELAAPIADEMLLELLVLSEVVESCELAVEMQRNHDVLEESFRGFYGGLTKAGLDFVPFYDHYHVYLALFGHPVNQQNMRILLYCNLNRHSLKYSLSDTPIYLARRKTNISVCFTATNLPSILRSDLSYH